MGFFKRHRIKNPVEGHALIVDCWLPPQNGAGGGNCKMKLELDVPGIEPQVVPYHELSMTHMRWPEVGMRVAVTVDKNHPDRVDVHWESVFGEVRGGLLGRGAELLGSAVGVEMDLSTGPEPEGPPPPKALPDDQIPGAIAELNARHAAGEITYEEMAEGVKRVIGAG